MGRNTCNSSPVDILGVQLVEFTILQIAGRTAASVVSADAVQRNIERGTAKHRAIDVRQLAGIDPQLRSPDHGIDTKIHKRGHRNRPGDGDPIFQVGDQAGIPARKHDLLDRNRNRVAAAQADWPGSLGTMVPSGLRRIMLLLAGRNATGDTERISKPRISFSPPR